MGTHGRTEIVNNRALNLAVTAHDGSGYTVTAQSDQGEAEESLVLDGLRAVFGDQLGFAESSGTLAVTPATARETGSALFASVFTGAVGDLYERTVRSAPGRGLPIHLRVDPPELAALPWEFLYDSRRGEHLALSTSTPLVRGIDVVGDTDQPLTVPAPLRVLGVFADPSDLDHLHGSRERDLVEEALSSLQTRGLVELRWLEHATWRDLQRAMRLGPWHVLHFVGHGSFDPFRDEGYVILPGATGAAEPLSATELARLLVDSGSMQLALLNSCEGARGSEQDPFTSTAATLIRRGVPAVVAMQDAVSDRAAIEFGRAFYEAVADGSSIDAAVTEARKSVSLALPDSVEWATPVLFARDDADVLFRIEAEDWAAGAIQGNIPMPQTPIVGRLQEIAEIGDLLRGPAARLITLTGPGGVGKTRLAVESARRTAAAFPDGVDLIELAPVANDELVLPLIAQVVGVNDTGGRPLLDALTQTLVNDRRLLVLDNCEHLPAVGKLASQLLAACPKLKLLATSRARLRARGEREVPISPLAVPNLRKPPPLDALARVEAVALFVERARAARANFLLTEENAPHIAGICARLDGLPLAIELAAARVRAFPPKTLLGELDRRFDLLRDGPQDLFPHQQALETTIAWSYDQLTEADQALFRRLAVFGGGFGLDAADAVAHAAGAHQLRVSIGLTSLVDHSLIRLDDDENRDPRWRMLESLRAFGNDRLSELGEDEPTRRAHMTFFLHLTQEAAPHLNGPKQGEWLTRLADDHDNLRIGLELALSTADRPSTVAMVETLWRFWNARGYIHEGRMRVEETIRRFDATGPTEQDGQLDAKLFVAAGTLARAQGDYPAAEIWFATALERARTSEDRGVEAAALNNLGGVALSQGDHRRAADLFGQSLEISRALSDEWREAGALSNLGAAAAYLGEIDKAEARYEAALVIWEKCGDRRRAAQLMSNLVVLLAPLPERREKAKQLGERCLVESHTLNFPTGIAAALTGLGLVAEGEGDLHEAARCHEESAAVCRESEDRGGLARALGNLGLIVADLGDLNRGAELARESLQIFAALGDEEGIATTLEMVASIARLSGDSRLATRLHGAAASRWTDLTMPLPMALARRHETSVAALRSALSDADFDAEWAAGRELAVAEVQREMDRLFPVAAATTAAR